MRFSYQAHVLLLALFTATNFALTVPSNAALPNPAAPSDTLQAATQLDATGPRNTLCSISPPGQVINPELYMCATALRGLPSTADVGYFSITAARNFQLPTFSRWKNCEVLVEPKFPHSRVRSSWVEIGLAAVQLNEACQGVRDTSMLGSGVTYAGLPDGIKISLRPYNGPYLGANATLTATS